MQVQEGEFTFDSLSGYDIQQRQQSCFIKDLPKEEVPDFFKEGFDQKINCNRMTIKDIVFKVTLKDFILFVQDSEDESLTRYKQALLGDLAHNMELLQNSDKRKC